MLPSSQDNLGLETISSQGALTMRLRNFGVFIIIGLTLPTGILSNPALAASKPNLSNFQPKCSALNKLLKDITPNEFNNCIAPLNWIDKGGHFLSQLKQRGNSAGINTFGDFVNDVRNGKDVPDKTPGRIDRVINLQTTKGKRPAVVYEYDKNNKGNFVTFLIS